MDLSNFKFELKPWDKFVQKPAIPQGDQIMDRLKKNISYWMSNYLIVVAAFMILLILKNPVAIIAPIASVGGAYYFFKMNKGADLVVGGIKIDKKMATYGLIGIGAGLLLIIAKADVFKFLIFAAIVICAHAIVIPPTTEKSKNKTKK
ncbi:prenylated rab acceptor protein [Anaeramoeba ignava]|uniref:PRA1 family protein n=1 Tax=Anaeramoeba ignava TaxID=1746090 RepID=A0A9Q0RHR1_ANAIG|nr:prenylated rab acceptor protein [Anaeramoeba ignava]|eukprot:Anaeramoba_ignava/a3635_752.p1 GENE.a3635_752~~a3635_752.p1  ORF type:complete len:148 (-),score=45.88 a3635_752:102-545(-)